MVIAANVIIMRVDGFAMMPNFSFGQAMSVYTGQNVGAGKWHRVHKGINQGIYIAEAFFDKRDEKERNTFRYTIREV
ncbi:MAG: hypothetical protein IIX36_08975, partial [Clostridia bacterium]|nr:hypothetical protein [Clostridia bacterium]